MSTLRYCTLFLCISLTLLSCKRDEVVSYRVSKEAKPTSSAPPSMPVEQEPSASPGIRWEVPAGWEEQSPSGMRVGSLTFTGANGQKADISVIPLVGKAGGDLANVNRWRSQLGLEPVDQQGLTSISKQIEPAGRKMLLVEFESKEPIIDGKMTAMMISAIYPLDDKTWFFKMTGEKETVIEARPALLHFLETLKFN